MRSGTVLLVESNAAAARAIVGQLSADGLDVSHALSAGHANSLSRTQDQALVLLGALHGVKTALGLLEEIRGAVGDAQAGRWRPGTPVIVLGRSSCELELLRAFQAGADDFIAPPLRPLELRLRIDALLRRTLSPEPKAILEVRELTIDVSTRSVHLDAKSSVGEDRGTTR